MKVIFIILIFACALFAEYKNISNDQLQYLKANGITIIDVRTEPEWDDTGVIPGSILITSHTEKGFQYDYFINELKKQGIKDNFILVCRTGNRSKELAARLSAAQYQNVYNLQYGIKGWIKENRKVTKQVF